MVVALFEEKFALQLNEVHRDRARFSCAAALFVVVTSFPAVVVSSSTTARGVRRTLHGNLHRMNSFLREESHRC